jgi:murein DD-endopeptidase MepM/ murein hydrolase activator NlpD
VLPRRRLRFGVRAPHNIDGDMTTVGAAASLVSPASCPSCKGPVDLKSRHVAISGTAVQVYCSEACLRARDAQPVTPMPDAIEPPRRRMWWLLGGLVVGTTSLVLFYSREARNEQTDPRSIYAIVEAARQPPLEVKPVVAKPAHDPAADDDAALINELAHDAWIHPLAGPSRRMPSNHDAAFGALRAGERPPECVSGHCGVDIGSVWGEPVHAVHDGVVDWVNRGPNDEHGGIFVKVAHRDGSLYSWYFHLAAVPRWVQPGVKIKAGQVIGLLGDTGVGRSGPHLHFSLSVKPSRTAHERYLDPEPLIAIWPLWLPHEDPSSGRPTTAVAPGLPVREPDRPKPKPAEVDAGVPSEDGAEAASVR